MNNYWKTVFFIGNEPTIVEGQAYAILRWANGFKGGEPLIEMKTFPTISKFLNLMTKQRSVKNALAIEEQQTANLDNSQFAGYFKFSS